MPDRYDAMCAISECDFCDDEGIRLNGMHKCDHLDHAAASKRGMDMIRQTMGWK